MCEVPWIFVDSEKLAYTCTYLFRELKESLVACKEVFIRNLQRFAAKCVSIGLAVVPVVLQGS